tara:strand:+ start:134 stop:637 length:504 start_codon:yes stop_codon:yes gene_type:complete
MWYLSIKENANEAHQTKFNEIYSMVSMIRDYKEDIIYKSSIPRLKQTKLRGIQAFKEVVKKLTQHPKIKFDEATKNIWLNCFKIVYNYNSHALNVNNCECITFDKNITLDEIKEKLGLEECILGEKEPNCFEHTDEFVESIFQYIMAEKLKEKDLMKLVNKIFNVLC